jgi:hypothetical protein
MQAKRLLGWAGAEKPHAVLWCGEKFGVLNRCYYGTITGSSGLSATLAGPLKKRIASNDGESYH